MRLFKLIFLTILMLLPWKLASADDFPKKAISLIIKCYNNSAHKNSEVGECIQEQIRRVPNPLDYTVRLRATDLKQPGHYSIKIVMINKTGLMIYCLGSANKHQLSIGSCASEKGAPPSSAQKMSIDVIF